MLPNMRNAVIIPICTLLSLVGIFGLYLWQIGTGQKSLNHLPSTLINKPAPRFNLPPINRGGKGFSTKMLRGNVSLVNIWASWCIPCRVEHPYLMKLAQDGFSIYGINYKDDPKNANTFLKVLGNPYRAVGADHSGLTSIDWGVYGYPETFIVDSNGYIRYRHVGPLSETDLSNTIQPILKRLEN
ncbi:MAG: DsbE family thiol:disulfide interchange protein [Rhodospirillaceae bacterium]|nr:DsbE family thiol:disulfide interchange protein [Rhodospirillaceae bacterium]|tara:strand:+ start:5728 stop:6282 length:555 start_codon:yes stop_codon:yes gene_type:complete